jgi:hypothetical protein
MTENLKKLADSFALIIKEQSGITDADIETARQHMGNLESTDEVLYNISPELGTIKATVNAAGQSFLLKASNAEITGKLLMEYQLWITLAGILDNIFWIIIRIDVGNPLIERVSIKRDGLAYKLVKVNVDPNTTDMWELVKNQLID